MSDETASLIRFKYEIELLEDLHAGSGLGSAWVDRTLRRDGEGTPFIPASHVKGIWRDAMVRMISLGADGFTEAFLDSWFGAAPKHKHDKTAPKQGRLYCPRLVPADRKVESLVWMQTARKRYSRRPEADTLRTTEYLPAGIQLSGEGYFEGTNAEFETLRKLVDRVERYGGNRSRGDGRIRRIEFESVEQPVLTWPEKPPTGIRLLLRARAPVRVPRTGSPGNIIESDTRIPGRMLAGAIISPLIRKSAATKPFFEGAVAIGDALPLNPESRQIGADELSKLEVLPAPFEYRNEKQQPKACRAFEHMPAWAKTVGADSSVDGWRDTLAEHSRDEHSADQTQLKRLPAATYIQRLVNQSWRAYRQPRELAMRNRRGSDRQEQYAKMDSELFSNEQLPAGTFFVADIRPLGKDKIGEDWWKTFRDHFSKAPVLFVGRGRAPVEIAAIAALSPSTGSSSASNTKKFRLTLTSDAIIRTEWLGFHQRLTVKALCDALNEKSVPDGITALDVSEARIDRAFNAATRLPRPSVMMLRAGSSIEVRGEGASSLRRKLQKMSAIGERQHEGLGRFRLDLDVLTDAQGAGEEAGAEPQEQVAELRTESVARFATHLASTHATALGKPSTSQLGNVRARLDAIGQGAAEEGLAPVKKIREILFKVSKETKGGEVFYLLAREKGESASDGEPVDNNGPLAELIGEAEEQGWTVEDVRLAWRLMLARVPRKMDPDVHGGEQDDHEAETEEYS